MTRGAWSFTCAVLASLSGFAAALNLAEGRTLSGAIWVAGTIIWFCNYLSSER